MPSGTTSYKLVRLFRRLAADTSGASMVEYGLLVALIAVGLLASLSVMGDALTGVMNVTSTSIDDATP